MTYTPTGKIPQKIADRYPFDSSHLCGRSVSNYDAAAWLRRSTWGGITPNQINELTESDTNIWLAALHHIAECPRFGNPRSRLYAVVSYGLPIAWAIDEERRTEDHRLAVTKRPFYLANIAQRNRWRCSRSMRAIEKHLTLVQHGQALVQTTIQQATVARVA